MVLAPELIVLDTKGIIKLPIFHSKKKSVALCVVLGFIAISAS